MAESVLVPLIPAVTFIFSALILLCLYRDRLSRCFSRDSKNPVYTDIPDIESESESNQSAENPASDDPPPFPTETDGSWIDSLVERAVHQVWLRLDLDSLFEPAPPIHHGTAIHGDPDKRCGNARSSPE